MLKSLEEKRNICILGDYGTGKTVIIQSVADKLRNSDRDLVYINALDTADTLGHYFKTWEDVLDVIVKLRFTSGVTVQDIGTLRRNYLERNIGRTSRNYNCDKVEREEGGREEGAEKQLSKVKVGGGWVV